MRTNQGRAYAWLPELPRQPWRPAWLRLETARVPPRDTPACQQRAAELPYAKPPRTPGGTCPRLPRESDQARDNLAAVATHPGPLSAPVRWPSRASLAGL